MYLTRLPSILLLFLVSTGLTAHADEECEALKSADGKFENCTTDFFALECALFAQSDNIYNLSRAFYAYKAHSSSSGLVVIIFQYNATLNPQKWYWTENMYFFIVEPGILQHLSLRFSHNDSKQIRVELTLPGECWIPDSSTLEDPDYQRMEFLTQKVEPDI